MLRKTSLLLRQATTVMLVLGCLGLISSCVTVRVPTYQPVDRPDAALLLSTRGPAYSLILYTKERPTRVIGVDGLRFEETFKSMYRGLPLAPGKHAILFSVDQHEDRGGVGAVAAEFKARHTYELRARNEKGIYQVEVVDTTGGAATIVASTQANSAFQLQSWMITQPVVR